MVTRRLKQILVAILAAGTVASASESSILSYRAQRSFDSGKFAKGYGQLERALLASRKEADLRSEARVLIAMAQIRTMSLDLDFADSLLSVVRENVLDKNTRIQLAKTKVALLSARNKYSAAVKVCDSFDDKSLKSADENVQAAFYGGCAIAYAANRDMKRANESLKMAGKRSDKKSGFYAFTAARMAFEFGVRNLNLLEVINTPSFRIFLP